MIKILIAFAIISSFVVHVPAAKSTCESITIEQCKNIGYNRTTLSSHEDQSGQYAFAVFMMNIHPLIRSECSPKLNFFLCTAYLPMCVDGLPPIGPCRGLCQKVKSDCDASLKMQGYSWPEDLDCSQYHHEIDHSNMCIVSNV